MTWLGAISCRLWPPDSINPAPIARLKADVATHIVSKDLRVLWSAASTEDAHGEYVAPSEAVSLERNQHVAQPLLALNAVSWRSTWSGRQITCCRCIETHVIEPQLSGL